VPLILDINEVLCIIGGALSDENFFAMIDPIQNMQFFPSHFKEFQIGHLKG
jgi:hypothetical protein